MDLSRFPFLSKDNDLLGVGRKANSHSGQLQNYRSFGAGLCVFSFPGIGRNGVKDRGWHQVATASELGLGILSSYPGI